MPKNRTNRACEEKSAKKPYSRSNKSVVCSVGESKPKKRSAKLTWFLKVYKGLNDWHIPIFTATKQYTNAKRVLYPGSDKHLTASLCFTDVTYVDCNKKIEPVFKDEQVLEWVNENKLYSEEVRIKFLCKNFESDFEKAASFDLMISACAGIVSEPCCKYLKLGGYFLVSDAHFDARATFLRQDFKLEGVYDMGTKKFATEENDLTGHFHTKNGKPLTKAQVEESMVKPKAKRSFKLKKEGMFYLFKKIKLP